VRQAPLAGVVIGLVHAALGLGAAAQETERTLERGRVELSTAASFNSTRGEGEDESYSVLNLPARVGWFATRRVELEGEVLLSHFSGDGDGETGVVGSGRVLYHFGDGARVAPFVFAGGGIGNAAELLGHAVDAARTVRHWELGAGVKFFAGPRAAFRLDYRFARFAVAADDDFEFDLGGDHTNTHRVFAGISLFLR
jgi:hypothetical protein